MVYINGNAVYDVPRFCGECTSYLSFGTQLGIGNAIDLGLCKLFDKQKRYWDNPPKRCKEIFEKAFTFPEGENLVITEKHKE